MKMVLPIEGVFWTYLAEFVGVCVSAALHYSGHSTVLFVLGAVGVNSLLTLIRLAKLDWIYVDEIRTQYIRSIYLQTCYFVTRFLLYIFDGLLYATVSLLRPLWQDPGLTLSLVLAIWALSQSPFARWVNWAAIPARLFFTAGRRLTLTFMFIDTTFERMLIFSSYIHQVSRRLSTVLDRSHASLWLRDNSKRFYHHQPLLPDEIRLLIVKRKFPFLAPRTTLLNIKIENAPAYDAISYTWGTTTTTRPIRIDDDRYQVSTATYNAIVGCSSFWRAKVLWIDYLCINQSDPIEKAHQVTKMIEVYQRARQVLVYLGGVSILSLLTLSILTELIHHSTIKTPEDYLYTRYEIEMLLPRWQALSKFFNHPWFTRVWIIQEVAVAEHVTFVYCGLLFKWETMFDLGNIFDPSRLAHLLQMARCGRKAYSNIVKMNRIDAMRHTRRLYTSHAAMWQDTNSRFFDSLMELFDIKSDLSTAKVDPLHELLTLERVLTDFADFNATDGRDRVYALQGLTVDSLPPTLRPDYQKSLPTLFEDLAKHFWSSNTPFATIAWAGIGHDRNVSIPSWAADWTCRIGAGLLTMPCQAKYNVSYRASEARKPSISLASLNSGIVIVQGILIDEIQDQSSICVLQQGESEFIVDSMGNVMDKSDLQDGHQWHREAFGMAMKKLDPHSDYAEYSCRVNMFWRTLCGDRTLTERPAPPETALLYHIWKLLIEMTGSKSISEASSVLSSPIFWQGQSAGAPWGPLLGSGSANKRFCITTRNRMGTVPKRSQPGDKICIAYGARTPWVVRPVSVEKGEEKDDGKDYYQLVGECFIYGIMDGELIDEFPGQEFYLV